MIRRNAQGKIVADYETLIPEELEQALAEDAIVYVPTGAIEWHNAHLPFNTDSLIADGLAHRLAEETGGVILPVNPWATACTFTKRGPYPFEHSVGSVALYDPDLYLRLTRAIAQGILDNGFRRIVFVPGHVGHDDRVAIEKVADEINAAGQARALFLYIYLFTKGDHAGHWETLMLLGLRPDQVRSGKKCMDFAYGRAPLGTESAQEGRQKVDELVNVLKLKINDWFGLR
jgi:creatinine amidohydrolase